MGTRKNSVLIRQEDLTFNEDYYDVLGAIIMMRCLLSSGGHLTLPTIIDFAMKKTALYFTNEVKAIKVTAFDRPLKARLVVDMANWEAWTGISGPFSGWFSDDEAAIPLKIRLKIPLGRVTLELEHIRRPDWIETYKNTTILSSSREGGSKQ